MISLKKREHTATAAVTNAIDNRREKATAAFPAAILGTLTVALFCCLRLAQASLARSLQLDSPDGFHFGQLSLLVLLPMVLLPVPISALLRRHTKSRLIATLALLSCATAAGNIVLLNQSASTLVLSTMLIVFGASYECVRVGLLQFLRQAKESSTQRVVSNLYVLDIGATALAVFLFREPGALVVPVVAIRMVALAELLYALSLTLMKDSEHRIFTANIFNRKGLFGSDFLARVSATVVAAPAFVLLALALGGRFLWPYAATKLFLMLAAGSLLFTFMPKSKGQNVFLLAKVSSALGAALCLWRPEGLPLFINIFLCGGLATIVCSQVAGDDDFGTDFGAESRTKQIVTLSNIALVALISFGTCCWLEPRLDAMSGTAIVRTACLGQMALLVLSSVGSWFAAEAVKWRQGYASSDSSSDF
ncbi:MAG TPA: hypothetical protein V6C97_22940 [Oculatellaceae cyanobacterium]